VRGSKGPEVQAFEQRLTDLKYDAGKVDGTFDAATGHAVMAFQKATGMARTGRATPDVIDAAARAGEPGPMLPDGGANRVEIDLKRQVLQLYKGGALVRVLSVSTGNNKRYCVDGECAVAVTPGGSFKVNRKIRGLRVSRLGQLYNPLYFNGGIAMHGSASVPATAASHGCVRVPMNSSLWLFDNVPSGTPVYVIGGKTAPVPFNEQAPPADESTTTTAAPTTTTPAPTTTGVPTTTEPPTTTVPPTTTTSTTAPVLP
jgi:peptidoglycan hydrolase-like protein with peptidoglycan-binding domain